MKFNLTIDKTAEAVIDERICINCGKCSRICPSDAVEECRKTVYCMFPDCSVGKGTQSAAVSFKEAKRVAEEMSCAEGCPLGIVPQAVASLVDRGDIEGAYELIAEKNPLPGICAAICEQECMEHCKRGNLLDAPVNIRGLERYVLNRSRRKPLRHIRKYSERIAVIGAGPAGLAAAFELSAEGYSVTVFEKDKRAGGVLRWGTPDFRLDRSLLDEEIDRILSAGIDVRYGYNIGEDHGLEDILNEGFAACLIAVGASEGVVPEIRGAESRMVCDWVRLMRQINGEENEGIELGSNVIIIGGGEMAEDAARVLLRMGRNVVCAAAEAPDDLQISDDSFRALVREGAAFKPLVEPKQIISENGIVKAVEFIRVEYIEDDRGVSRPQQIKGSEFNMFCDTVVFAEERKCSVGRISNVETYPDGKIKVDSWNRTNKDMIFACGDAADEGETTAQAMASGRDAARAIDAVLRGSAVYGKAREISGAPDSSVIYPENVAEIKPQFEKVIRDGEEHQIKQYAEDIEAILHDAGVSEDLPRFSRKAEDGSLRRKVAVIGGGVAGITAAIELAGAGYMPTIFEKYTELGGRYRWLSSSKRVNKELLAAKLGLVEKSGIEVVYNAAAGVAPDIEELFAQGYEAVLFAIGESCGKLPDMENVSCRGVFELTALMSRLIGRGEIDGVGRHIVITGCDEMTFDAARMLREYDSQVTVISPLGKTDLRECITSIAAAVDEGVNLVTGVELDGIKQKNGVLTGIKCLVKERNISIDIECDTVVIGGTARPDTHAISMRNPKLETDSEGYIVADRCMVTSMYGVFATGDFSGTAVEAGRAGAAAVRNFLEGKEIIPVVSSKPSEGDEKDPPKYEIFEGRRYSGSGFETGRCVFDREQAAAEASRCLGCGYSRQISERCIGCGICELVCPAGAITLRQIRSEEVER